MEGHATIERRGSMFITNLPTLDTVDHQTTSDAHLRSPSPETLSLGQSNMVEKKKNTPSINITRSKTNSEVQYADTEVDELFAMLRESESLDEQGDILQYLVDTKGLDFHTGMLDFGKVRDVTLWFERGHCLMHTVICSNICLIC